MPPVMGAMGSPENRRRNDLSHVLKRAIVGYYMRRHVARINGR